MFLKAENKPKTILITRPKKQSELLAQELQKQGYKTITQPLFTVKTSSDFSQFQNLKNLQAILITSANAVDFLKKSQLSKNILILAVGAKTADQIKKTGYKNVFSAANSAASLLELALTKLSPQKGKIFYLSGKIITLDLAKELRKKGFDAQKIQAYSTLPRAKLSKNLFEKIRGGKIDYVLIYSKNSAAIFYNLLTKDNLLESFGTTPLLCLSDKICDYCFEIGFKKIINFDYGKRAKSGKKHSGK